VNEHISLMETASASIPKISCITLFPNMFEPFFREGVLSRAVTNKIVSLETIPLREFALDSRKSVDDSPYGGGDGLVLLPSVCEAALKSVLQPNSFVIEVSPRGKIFNAQAAKRFSRIVLQNKHLVFLCGRYAGFDDRFSEKYVHEKWSVGDFVLSGGEYPALFMMDALLRYVPGVLGNEMSAHCDSHSDGLLEAPSYTKPVTWHQKSIPEVLLSGDHKKIAAYRRTQQVLETAKQRPDLVFESWETLSKSERALATKLFQSSARKDIP
jgi:tRNA (guanine37-N1)-methyltransferase